MTEPPLPLGEYVTTNRKEFPGALYCPRESRLSPQGGKIIKFLINNGIRPTPERVEAVSGVYSPGYSRDVLGRAFVSCESVAFPKDPLAEGFDVDFPRMDTEEVREALEKSPENRSWISGVLARASQRYHISLPDDPICAARALFGHLAEKRLWWEADAFPLEAMTELKNRYHWTFTTNAWSLREQLRRESVVINRAWKKLLSLSAKAPILLILNERTPTDYFTCRLPAFASLMDNREAGARHPILLRPGVKISSSEHRDPLKSSSEGEALESALNDAQALGRKPILVDFSRRRFPRSFLRIYRYVRDMGLGVNPLWKLRDKEAKDEPPAKSPRGFYPLEGDNHLSLYDPWPISDPDIISGLTRGEESSFCYPPDTKPWQDDRIGARSEMEMDEEGVYTVVSRAWAVPAMGGWMRADQLFKSRLGRFIKGNSVS